MFVTYVSVPARFTSSGDRTVHNVISNQEKSLQLKHKQKHRWFKIFHLILNILSNLLKMSESSQSEERSMEYCQILNYFQNSFLIKTTFRCMDCSRYIKNWSVQRYRMQKKKQKKTRFLILPHGIQEHKTAYKLTISMHHPTIRATLSFSGVTSFLARSLYESTTASPLFFFPNGTLYSKTLIWIICFCKCH